MVFDCYINLILENNCAYGNVQITWFSRFKSNKKKSASALFFFNINDVWVVLEALCGQNDRYDGHFY